MHHHRTERSTYTSRTHRCISTTSAKTSTTALYGTIQRSHEIAKLFSSSSGSWRSEATISQSRSTKRYGRKVRRTFQRLKADFSTSDSPTSSLSTIETHACTIFSTLKSWQPSSDPLDDVLGCCPEQSARQKTRATRTDLRNNRLYAFHSATSVSSLPPLRPPLSVRCAPRSAPCTSPSSRQPPRAIQPRHAFHRSYRLRSVW